MVVKEEIAKIIHVLMVACALATLCFAEEEQKRHTLIFICEQSHHGRKAQLQQVGQFGTVR